MIDLIIRAKDGRELTEAAIKSIRDNTPAGTYRIILVDDGSDPPLYDLDYDEYVRHGEPRGAVTATNSGMALSMGLDSQYAVIFDNDIEVPQGDTEWLERWVREIEKYPNCAACGATTNYAQPPQHILTVPQTYTGDWEGGTKENIPVVWFISFAVMIRKDVYAQLGPWDEQYNPGNWEDTDYALTVRKHGYTVRVARSVYIHHHGHKTFSSDLKRLMTENREKFLRKWGAGTAWDMGLVRDDAMMEILRVRQRSQQGRNGEDSRSHL